MIEIADVAKTLGTNRALDSFSAVIGPGINGLVGRNGAGKSTLLRLISGVFFPDRGAITVDGFAATDARAKKRLFFLADDPYSPALADVAALAAFYSCFYALDRAHYLALIAKLRLPPGKKLASFSKGMRRQAFLALALSIDCEVLLLDEAFDGLDPLALDTVKEEIVSTYGENGKTVLVASHNLQSLDRLCDRFVMIADGRKYAEGTADDIGKSFAKFQVAVRNGLDAKAVSQLGLDVVSFRKNGSVYEIVCRDNGQAEALLGSLKPLLLDRIPIDTAELVTLEMRLAESAREQGK